MAVDENCRILLGSPIYEETPPLASVAVMELKLSYHDQTFLAIHYPIEWRFLRFLRTLYNLYNTPHNPSFHFILPLTLLCAVIFIPLKLNNPILPLSRK